MILRWFNLSVLVDQNKQLAIDAFFISSKSFNISRERHVALYNFHSERTSLSWQSLLYETKGSLICLNHLFARLMI